MTKYICKGAAIQRKSDPTQTGTVYVVDRKSGIVVAKNGDAYWSDKIKNVAVMSYAEVE